MAEAECADYCFLLLLSCCKPSHVPSQAARKGWKLQSSGLLDHAWKPKVCPSQERQRRSCRQHTGYDTLRYRDMTNEYGPVKYGTHIVHCTVPRVLLHTSFLKTESDVERHASGASTEQQLLFPDE